MNVSEPRGQLTSNCPFNELPRRCHLYSKGTLFTSHDAVSTSHRTKPQSHIWPRLNAAALCFAPLLGALNCRARCFPNNNDKGLCYTCICFLSAGVYPRRLGKKYPGLVTSPSQQPSHWLIIESLQYTYYACYWNVARIQSMRGEKSTHECCGSANLYPLRNYPTIF